MIFAFGPPRIVAAPASDPRAAPALTVPRAGVSRHDVCALPPRNPHWREVRLTRDEVANLRSQVVTSSWSRGWGGRRHTPYAFTEHGVAMLSSVLRSPRAIEVNIAIMRTFVRLRQMLASNGNVGVAFRAYACAQVVGDPQKYDASFEGGLRCSPGIDWRRRPHGMQRRSRFVPQRAPRGTGASCGVPPRALTSCGEPRDPGTCSQVDAIEKKYDANFRWFSTRFAADVPSGVRTHHADRVPTAPRRSRRRAGDRNDHPADHATLRDASAV